MKKEYTKPGIIIESFEISQNISAGCGAIPGKTVGGKVNTSQVGVCGWQDNGSLNIIWVDDSKCTTGTPADSEIYGFCYNNPDGTTIMKLFTS